MIIHYLQKLAKTNITNSAGYSMMAEQINSFVEQAVEEEKL